MQRGTTTSRFPIARPNPFRQPGFPENRRLEMSQPMARQNPTRPAPMPLVSQRRADLAELERCMALSDCNEVAIDFRSGVGVYRPVMRAEKAAKPKPWALVVAFRR